MLGSDFQCSGSTINNYPPAAFLCTPPLIYQAARICTTNLQPWWGNLTGQPDGFSFKANLIIFNSHKYVYVYVSASLPSPLTSLPDHSLLASHRAALLWSTSSLSSLHFSPSSLPPQGPWADPREVDLRSAEDDNLESNCIRSTIFLMYLNKPFTHLHFTHLQFTSMFQVNFNQWGGATFISDDILLFLRSEHCCSSSTVSWFLGLGREIAELPSPTNSRLTLIVCVCVTQRHTFYCWSDTKQACQPKMGQFMQHHDQDFMRRDGKSNLNSTDANLAQKY